MSKEKKQVYKAKILSGQVNQSRSKEELKQVYNTEAIINVYRQWLNSIEKAFEDGIRDGSIDYGSKLEDLIVNQDDLKKMVQGFNNDLDSGKDVSVTRDFNTSFEKLQISEDLSTHEVSEGEKGMHDQSQDIMAGE